MQINNKSTTSPNNQKLSRSDLILLSELEGNSRQSLSQLAKKLRISQQLLSYRLQSLKKRNIIKSFYTQINFTRFGYTRYRIMLRLSNFSQQKEEEIIRYLMNHPNVQWIVECGGRWDYIINFMAKHIIQFDQFLREFKKKFPKQVQNYNVLTIIEVIELGRSYFTKSYRNIDELPIFGRKFESINIDNTDLKILDLLSENARITSAEISKKVGVSLTTVSSRIKNMVRKKIIRGFKPLIHLENTPYSTFKTPIKLQNHTEEKEKEIIDYLKTDVRVVAIIKLIGQWNFEMEFEVDSRESMLELTRNFRDKFKDVVSEFELVPLFHEYRYNFFPRDLIKQL